MLGLGPPTRVSLFTAARPSGRSESIPASDTVAKHTEEMDPLKLLHESRVRPHCALLSDVTLSGTLVGGTYHTSLNIGVWAPLPDTPSFTGVQKVVF